MGRFWLKVAKRAPDECWPWTGFTEDGYGMFWLEGRPQRASRVSWVLANGPIPHGLFVLHRCDCRACVNPKCLFLGTHLDNMRDMREKGRAVCPARERPELQARGERSGAARLDNAKVATVRLMAASGLSQRKIAAQFGVDHKTIAAVIHGRTWAHLPGAVA